MNTKKYTIIKKAEDLGFFLAGFTKPYIDEKETTRYKYFLDKNYQGDMKWLEKHFETKNDPKKLWSEVKSILILGINYGPGLNPIIFNKNTDMANISVYARNKDYHRLIKDKLKILQNFIQKEFSIKSKYFVDSSPVFEKKLAMNAGLGWIGKHTNLVSKELGSWFFLSEIFLSENFESDNEEFDKCGDCKKCLDICPTNAFVGAYKMDAKKCISYLTIESYGPFPVSLREKIGNKIFGCDDCLSVCPWNKFSNESTEQGFKANEKYLTTSLKYFLNLKEEDFKEFFFDSPIRRIGWERLMRNVIIAAGNSKNKSFVIELKKFLKNKYPLVRGSAIWSLGKLISKDQFQKLKDENMYKEKNSYVIFEWQNI